MEEEEEGDGEEEEGVLSGGEHSETDKAANSSGSDHDVLSDEELSEDCEPQPAVKSKWVNVSSDGQYESLCNMSCRPSRGFRIYQFL